MELEASGSAKRAIHRIASCVLLGRLIYVTFPDVGLALSSSTGIGMTSSKSVVAESLILCPSDCEESVSSEKSWGAISSGCKEVEAWKKTAGERG